MEYQRLQLPEMHDDFDTARRIEEEILRNAKGFDRFSVDFPRLLRQAIDEVIDAPRSKRFTVAELGKTEKTYLGTKIEILLRNYLGFDRGCRMDLLIDGIEVDVKNTMGATWTIPVEALGHPCILISEIEAKAKCSFGIVVIKEGILNKGKNRDQKRTIRAESLGTDVHWILRHPPYPENFWQTLSKEDKKAITAPKGATERLVALFRLNQGKRITRSQVEALAQQKDAMKRLRANGGARDGLRKAGIALLSGNFDKQLIEQLGLPHCQADEFISFKPVLRQHIKLCQDAGKLE